jgi:hypothetical protein
VPGSRWWWGPRKFEFEGRNGHTGELLKRSASSVEGGGDESNEDDRYDSFEVMRVTGKMHSLLCVDTLCALIRCALIRYALIRYALTHCIIRITSLA